MQLFGKNLIKSLDIAQIFAILYLFSWFFSIRHHLETKYSNTLGFYSDFTAISLYLSTFLLSLAFIFTFLPERKHFIISIKPLFLLISWLTLVIFIGLLTEKGIIGLNIITSIKFIEVIVAYGTLSVIFSKSGNLSLFLKIFVYLSIFQAFLAYYQFFNQSPFGLYALGEPHLNPIETGFAKIISQGTALLRAYGTFPHPNLLSAYFITSTLISVHFFTKSNDKKGQFFWVFSLLFCIFGLILTFSRAGIIALTSGLIVYGFLHLRYSNNLKSVIQVLFIAVFATLTFITVFRNQLITRTNFNDPALKERVSYAQTGFTIIKKHPFTGIGAGESLLHMEQYAGKKLWPWQIQPIHNYFILSAAEIGIIGSLLLLAIFLFHLKQLFMSISSKISLNPNIGLHILFFVIISSYLVLMQFDHYFYTLQQTQILLWAMLGLSAASLIKSPNASAPGQKDS